MTQSYVPKRRPGRPPRTEFIKVTGEGSVGAEQDVSVASLSIREKVINWVTANLPLSDGKSLEQSILDAFVDGGSTVIQRYLDDGKQIDVSTLLSFLLREKLMYFDGPPIPGDLLFLQRDGYLTTFRVVTQVIAVDPPTPPENSWPTWRNNLLQHQRMVQTKTYRVLLHENDEPVTSWYAVAKIEK